MPFAMNKVRNKIHWHINCLRNLINFDTISLLKNKCSPVSSDFFLYSVLYKKVPLIFRSLALLKLHNVGKLFSSK